VRPADSKRRTVVSRRVSVLRMAKSECGRQSEGRLTVRFMNVTNQDQMLSESTTIEHGEPAVWAAAIDDQ